MYNTAALVILLLAGVVTGQTDGQCSSSSDKLKRFSFRWTTVPEGPVYVGDLGVDQAIRIFCLDIEELPSVGTCSLPGVAVLCRDTYSDMSTCTVLSEYTYEAVKEVTYGDSNGPDVRWVLLWDPRNSPAQCYPRDVSVTIAYQLESPGGGSTVLAVTAIIIVTLLVIVICIFGLSRLIETTRAQKEAKSRALQGTGITLHGDMAGGRQDLVLCPKCGQGQFKTWEGVDPLMDMRCRNCGKSSRGWTELASGGEVAMLPPLDVIGQTPAAPPRRTGYTAAEVAMRYDFDNNLLFEEKPVGDEFGGNNNPLDSAFPTPTRTPRQHTMDPDAVWDPPPRLH